MLQWGSVEMNEIIQEMVALMRDEAAQRSIVIRAEMAENLRPITERPRAIAAGAPEPDD
jgi:hypothetical protein